MLVLFTHPRPSTKPVVPTPATLLDTKEMSPRTAVVLVDRSCSLEGDKLTDSVTGRALDALPISVDGSRERGSSRAEGEVARYLSGAPERREAADGWTAAIGRANAMGARSLAGEPVSRRLLLFLCSPYRLPCAFLRLD